MGNNMEAPERIWLDSDAEAGEGMFPRCFENPKYCNEPPVEYIRADLAAPSAPAEVAGLVERLRKADRGYEPGTMITEAATALTAQQAEIERLQGMERDTYVTWKKVAGDLQARAEKAEAERDAWKANAESLAQSMKDHTAMTGSNSSWMTNALAAHAKLKGGV